MSLDKITNSHEWDWQNLADVDLLDVTLYLANPALETVAPMLPRARLLFNNQVRKQNLEQLNAAGLLVTCVPFPSARQPRGATCTVRVDALQKLCDYASVESVSVDKVAASRIKKHQARKKQQFFCVKTTVAVQIEDVTDGLQLYEERLVLIRAASCEQACEKVQAASAEYAQPYLNSDGQLVRWQLESVDDCYETSLTALNEFNNPAGTEVFSVLKRRRMTPERVWNGKTA